MNTNDATRASAEGMPATQIQILFREWEAKYRHATKGGFTDGEMETLCDELVSAADKLLTLPSQAPMDVIAKLVAATDDFDAPIRDEWLHSIRDEALAFLKGVPDAQPIFEPSRLNMVGLFSLYEALTTVHKVITALCCRPIFESGQERVLSPAGEMLDRLADFVAGTLQGIRDTACERPAETPEDQGRKFFFLAHGVIDGQANPAHSVAELTKSVATLGEVRS